jgi:hypothetical protein
LDVLRGPDLFAPGIDAAHGRLSIVVRAGFSVAATVLGAVRPGALVEPTADLPYPRRSGTPQPRSGYGGVAIPPSTVGGGYLWPAIPRERRSGEPLLWGALDLSGPLLPELTVARDRVRALPFGVHLAVQGALWRAAAAFEGTPFAPLATKVQRLDLFAVPPRDERRMADLLAHEAAWVAWRSVQVVDVGHAGLRPLAMRWPERHHKDFYSVLAVAWAQQMLPLVVVSRGRGNWSLALRPGSKPQLTGLIRFPPLWFLPYDAASDLFQLRGAPANLAHPLVAWCRKNGETVERHLPHYLRRIVRALDPDFDETLEHRVERLNAVFDDLARLRPDLDVPGVRLAPPDVHGVIRSR